MSTPTEARRLPATLGLLAAAAALVAVVAVLVAALWWRGEGGRWFVVETPSMGTALPVGTLVLTAPVDLGDLAVGDVVTFRAARSGTTHTHRVVATSTEGVTTKGDVNAVRDIGTVGQDDLVGLVVQHAPVLGWVLRAAPIAGAGLAVTWLLSLLLAVPSRRGVRLVGASLSVAVANVLLDPWVGLQRLTERSPAAAGAGPSLDVVSTGLLPVRAEQVGGGAVAALHDGEVATLDLARRADGSYDVAASLDLAWWGWAVLVAACLVPMVVAVLLAPAVEAPHEPMPERQPVPEAAGLATWFPAVPHQATDDRGRARRPGPARPAGVAVAPGHEDRR